MCIRDRPEPFTPSSLCVSIKVGLLYLALIRPAMIPAMLSCTAGRYMTSTLAFSELSLSYISTAVSTPFAVISFLSSLSATTVSYTHLDVYKRQMHSSYFKDKKHVQHASLVLCVLIILSTMFIKQLSLIHI